MTIVFSLSSWLWLSMEGIVPDVDMTRSWEEGTGSAEERRSE